MHCMQDEYFIISMCLHTEAQFTMYRIQSFIALLLGCFSPLSYYNQPIKLKMEESDDIEHTSINNFADISRNEGYVD